MKINKLFYLYFHSMRSHIIADPHFFNFYDPHPYISNSPSINCSFYFNIITITRNKIYTRYYVIKILLKITNYEFFFFIFF